MLPGLLAYLPGLPTLSPRKLIAAYLCEQSTESLTPLYDDSVFPLGYSLSM